MSVRYLLSLSLIPLVLSEPDLCRNPKLDSIAYITGQDMWFFTSGGYFWYIKEKDFPPAAPTGKLPDGFNRGDAAFYIDLIQVCSSITSRRTKTRISKNDRLVVVVEKVDGGNKVVDFDIQKKTWSKSRSLDQDLIIGQSNIDDPNEKIDSIFSIRGSEVFVVQKNNYAMVDFKSLCLNSTNRSKKFAAQSVDALQDADRDVPYDAITVKNDVQMYAFKGSKFWKSTVVLAKSRDGSIVISKGNTENVSSTFFKFKECLQNVAKPTEPTEGSEPQKGENVVKNSDQKQSEDQKDMANEEESGNDNNSESESGSGGVFLIVLIVVVSVVVVLVIGGVVFAMTRKSQPQQATGAKPPAQSAKSKAVKPSKPIASKASPAVISKK